MRLEGVSRRSMTLVGSGTTTVTSPPLFRGVAKVALTGATRASAVPDRQGRITFQVDLGPADAAQEYTLGADPAEVGRTVTFKPRR
jgi:hypothetical protein